MIDWLDKLLALTGSSPMLTEVPKTDSDAGGGERKEVLVGASCVIPSERVGASIGSSTPTGLIEKLSAPRTGDPGCSGGAGSLALNRKA